MAGFSWAATLEKVSADFPDTNFAIIDMVVDKPNVRSVVYKEQEGSYVVGVLAAMASQSKKVGFVGGMDIPLIRSFGCGYVGGAKAAGATEVIQNMTGDTPAAGTIRPRAARSPSRRSIRAPTWSTLRPAAPALACFRRRLMRASSASASIQPERPAAGQVLTSMVKRVDVAVYNAFTDAKDGNSRPASTISALRKAVSTTPWTTTTRRL